MTDGWLNVRDVAEYIGESVPTVYAMIRRGEIPAARFDGRRRYKVRRADLERIFDARIVRPCEKPRRLRQVPKPDSFAARNVPQLREVKNQ